MNRNKTVAQAVHSSQVVPSVQVVSVGIDVSKEKLDVQLLRSQDKNAKTSYKQFNNTPAGFAKLVRWADQLLEQLEQLVQLGDSEQTGQPFTSLKPHYCMES